MAKTNYLRVCQKFTGFGFTFFLGKQKHIKKCPKLVYIGVNHTGAAVFRTDDKTIVQEFPMAQMKVRSYPIKLAGDGGGGRDTGQRFSAGLQCTAAASTTVQTVPADVGCCSPGMQHRRR